jgi:hypothetical protein
MCYIRVRTLLNEFLSCRKSKAFCFLLGGNVISKIPEVSGATINYFLAVSAATDSAFPCVTQNMPVKGRAWGVGGGGVERSRGLSESHNLL